MKRKLRHAFDLQDFLGSAGAARKVVEFRRKQRIFSQGDPADAVLYVQEGAVRLSVLSASGKEAVVGMMGAGDFFGEGCLAGQPLRMGSATALLPTRLLVVEKKTMVRVLHQQHALADRFMAYVLARNIRIEEDLIDQLFNSSEKRLARALLLLAGFDEHQLPRHELPIISRTLLAEMCELDRATVDRLMNSFRKRGFLERQTPQNGGVQIHRSMMNVLLQG